MIASKTLFPRLGCRLTKLSSLPLFISVMCSPMMVCAQSAPVQGTALNEKKPFAAPAAKSGRQSDVVGALVQQISESGQILEIADRPSDRLDPPPEIAPGLAPVLSFRSLDRQARYRLGRLDLVVDDAGH